MAEKVCEPFAGGDFKVWSGRMEDHLMAKGFCGYVSGRKPKPDRKQSKWEDAIDDDFDKAVELWEEEDEEANYWKEFGVSHSRRNP